MKSFLHGALHHLESPVRGIGVEIDIRLPEDPLLEFSVPFGQEVEGTHAIVPLNSCTRPMPLDLSDNPLGRLDPLRKGAERPPQSMQRYGRQPRNRQGLSMSREGLHSRWAR